MPKRSFYDKLTPEGKIAFNEQLQQLQAGYTGLHKPKESPFHKKLGLFLMHLGVVANAQKMWCGWCRFEEAKAGMDWSYWKVAMAIAKIQCKLLDWLGKLVFLTI